jgi:hypothetical protein
VADELKAVALTAPESATRNRMSAADWERVGKYAGLPAIEYHLTAAKRELARWQRTVDRWEALRAQRAAQVEAGEWPPKVERVQWRDLKPGDVLLDDPDRETLIERAETGTGSNGTWTTAWFRINGALYSRSQPAFQEITIRPRAASDLTDN